MLDLVQQRGSGRTPVSRGPFHSFEKPKIYTHIYTERWCWEHQATLVSSESTDRLPLRSFSRGGGNQDSAGFWRLVQTG